MTGDDDIDEWPRDPVSAVDYLYMQLTFPHMNPSPDIVALPRDIAAIILECARKGLHKGRGKRGVPLGHLDKMHQEAAVSFARRRKKQLQAANPNMSAGDAKDQASGEAAKYLSERYGLNLAASTIKRRMET